MSRINWLQDQNIFSTVSGAELNDKVMFLHGLKSGLDITLVNPETQLPKDKFSIISNYTRFSEEYLQQAVDQGAVFFFHDYIFCKWRLFFPGLPKCRKCEGALKHLPLFEKAKGLIYLSPLHKKVYLKQFPSLKKIPSAVISSAINTKLFDFDHQKSPENSALTVNTLLSFKGKNNIIKYITDHQELNFTVAGHNPDCIELPKNAKYIGVQKYEDIPELFSRHKFYVELPNYGNAAFNRTAAEARLAGCKIITNKFLGAASYPEFRDRKAFKDLIDRAPENFWRFTIGAI